MTKKKNQMSEFSYPTLDRARAVSRLGTAKKVRKKKNFFLESLFFFATFGKLSFIFFNTEAIEYNSIPS